MLCPIATLMSITTYLKLLSFYSIFTISQACINRVRPYNLHSMDLYDRAYNQVCCVMCTIGMYRISNCTGYRIRPDGSYPVPDIRYIPSALAMKSELPEKLFEGKVYINFKHNNPSCIKT